MNHHRTCGLFAAHSERRPVTATFRLRFLAAFNRVRRTFRPRPVTVQTNLREAYLS
jgi:hypothetical protein